MSPFPTASLNARSGHVIIWNDPWYNLLTYPTKWQPQARGNCSKLCFRYKKRPLHLLDAYAAVHKNTIF